MDTGEDLLLRKPCKQPRTSQYHTSVRKTSQQQQQQQQQQQREQQKNAHSIDSQTSGSSTSSEGRDILCELLGVPTASLKITATYACLWKDEEIEKQMHYNLQCFRNLLQNLEDYKHRHALNLSLKREQWRQVHGFLVLYLGNIDLAMITRKIRSNNSSSCVMEIMKLICRSLWGIYKSVLPPSTLEKEELLVVSVLIIRHVSVLVDLGHANTSVSGIDKRQHDPLRIELISHFLALLLATPKTYLRTLPRNDAGRLNTLLVRLIFDSRNKELGRAATIHSNAVELLQVFTSPDISNPDDTVKPTTAALASLLKQPNGKLDPTPPTSNRHDCLLYWTCLAQSAAAATVLSKDCCTLDELVRISLSQTENDGIKRMAVDCLCLIARHREKPPDSSVLKGATTFEEKEIEPDWTMDALLRIITRASDITTSRRTIVGLRHCKPHTIPWQGSEFLVRVLSSLSAIATKIPEGNDMTETVGHRADAAGILLDIVESILAAGRFHILSYRQSLKYIAALLHTDHGNSEIYELVIKTVENEVKRSGRLGLALCCPKILNQLGVLSKHPWTPSRQKRKIMEIFEIVTRDDEASGLLTRQVKVLEAVVAAASSSYAASTTNDHREEDRGSNPQQLAIIVLLRLAQNICNRRILAKQVGVLACMIRYARALSNQETDQEMGAGASETTRGVCLKELKRRIMELADAM